MMYYNKFLTDNKVHSFKDLKTFKLYIIIRVIIFERIDEIEIRAFI